MILWIESHNTGTIVLLAFALCYALAAIICAAAIAASRYRFAADLKATTPTVLTPLSVIAGLLIAFLASNVWSNLGRANAYIGQESSAIREAFILTNSLPNDLRTTISGSLKNYLRFVEAEDWPAMNHGQANLRRSPPDLTEAMAALLSFVPTQPGQQLAQQRAVMALEQALEARRERILLSQTVIAPIQWLVILTLVTLVLLTIAMVHIDRPITVAVNLFTFATAVSVCLALLLVNDRPFAAGGNTVEPATLREIVPN